MKMRFWQKTYIFTLILFLLCLNCGILSLTVYTYKRNVQSSENTASAEQYYIAMSFERDYTDMTSSNSNSSPSLLMNSFGNHYGKKGILLAFKERSNVIYSNFNEDIQIGKNSLLHTDIENKHHIVISSEICNGKYDMIFAKNVQSLDTEFRSLMITYIVTAVSVSIFLAICLYFILKKLSEPLEKLRKTTEIIQSGDFSVTAEEKGDDEFNLLAKSFNSMLSKINEQMSSLENEAAKKQQLVDNMAHELRTPLTSIHGYAEYIEKANTTEERRLIAAKYIMTESERLQKISELLLDGAFIRENKIEMADVDISRVLLYAVQSLSLKSEKAHVELRCNTEYMAVKGNETLLTMLFYNLIENAIKACSDIGCVSIECNIDRVIITDNGRGMTSEQLLHITEPFYRTDKSRSRAEGGAGLGLALCKQIVLSHNAEMNFKSELGRGTEITVIFTTLQ